MNTKARNEFIAIVVGLAMIVVGMWLFISKTTVTSTFIEMEGFWKWWKVLLVFLPLIAGIVMLIVQPKLLGSKILAGVGAIALIVVIMANSTIVVEEKMSPVQWVICIGFTVVGVIICLLALFLKRRK